MSNVTPHKLVTNKYMVSYEDISASATSMTHHWYCPSDTSYLVYLSARVTTAFAGVTKPYVKLGFTDNTDAIIRNQFIDKANTLKIGTKGSQDGYCPAITNVAGAVQDRALYLTFGSAATNLSSLTAGEIEFVTVYAIPA